MSTYFAIPYFTELAEDKMTNMTIILMKNMRNMKNTTREKNVMTMTTVDGIQFVTKDWEYVFAENDRTGSTPDAAGVTAKENGTEYVMKQGDVPAATIKKQAGERDVLGQ